MAKEVIMPALGMAQETGTLLKWLKSPGETVVKGEPLMEIETDKATVEIEAPASGVLAEVSAQPGDVVPVGERIAVIRAPGEPASSPLTVTPVAERMAAEHRLDPAEIKPEGGRVQKGDVLAYLAAREVAPDGDRTLASPKARRLARERGLDLHDISGSGPEGAVLAADVLSTAARAPEVQAEEVGQTLEVSRIWALMAERVTQAWTTVPQFYLLREVNAAALGAWRQELRARGVEAITYTDLLLKLIAAALRQNPRLNASWQEGTIVLNKEINLGLAVAVENGLVVPVIHGVDGLGVQQIAVRRAELVGKAQAGKLSPDDLSGGTFTVSNLGMYGVDAFTAIVNPPQAAILAVSRIADRVMPVQGQPAVQPALTLSLTCDHRVVDGARGAQFLDDLSGLIEAPLRILD